MSTPLIIAILVFAAIGLFFYRRIRATRKDEKILIEKVKAATYIMCPHCGAALEINSDE